MGGQIARGDVRLYQLKAHYIHNQGRPLRGDSERRGRNEEHLRDQPTQHPYRFTGLLGEACRATEPGKD